jgi:hypothetical protein
VCEGRRERKDLLNFSDLFEHSGLQWWRHGPFSGRDSLALRRARRAFALPTVPTRLLVRADRAAAAVSAVAMVPTVQADCRPAARPAVPSLPSVLTDSAAWRCTRRRRRGDVAGLRSPRRRRRGAIVGLRNTGHRRHGPGWGPPSGPRHQELELDMDTFGHIVHWLKLVYLRSFVLRHCVLRH